MCVVSCLTSIPCCVALSGATGSQTGGGTPHLTSPRPARPATQRALLIGAHGTTSAVLISAQGVAWRGGAVGVSRGGVGRGGRWLMSLFSLSCSLSLIPPAQRKAISQLNLIQIEPTEVAAGVGRGPSTSSERRGGAGRGRDLGERERGGQKM